MAEKTIEIPTLSMDDVLGDIMEKTQTTNTENVSVDGEGTTENSDVMSDKVEETNNKSKSEKKSIYDLLEEEIMSAEISDAEKTKKLSRLLKIRGKKVNIMLTGATGSGKSSTINALFNMEVAKVGVGVDPETDCIAKYELDNLTIWDTPGLGDGVENEIFRDALGDYLAIGKTDKTLLYEGSEVLKSQHAGYTDDEILVPLIVIDCKKNYLNR